MSAARRTAARTASREGTDESTDSQAGDRDRRGRHRTRRRDGRRVASAGGGTVGFARKVVTPPATRGGRADPRRRPRRATRSCSRLRRVADAPAATASGSTTTPGTRDSATVVEDDDRVVRRRIDSVDFGRLDRAGTRPDQRLVPPRTVGARVPVRERRSSRPRSGPAPAWLVRGRRRRRDTLGDPGARARREATRGPARRAAGTRRGLEHAPHLLPQRRRGARERGPPVRARRHRVGRRRAPPSRSPSSTAPSSIVLMGWSMGGAISLQAVLRSPAVRERLVGIVLDSPGHRLGRHPPLPGPGATGCPSELGDAVSATPRRPARRRAHRHRARPSTSKTSTRSRGPTSSTCRSC